MPLRTKQALQRSTLSSLGLVNLNLELYSVSLGPGSHPWEKQAQGLASDVPVAIQGYTRSPGSANSLGLISGEALYGQKARGTQASLGHGSFNGQKPGG